MDWDKATEGLTAEERRSFYISYHKWVEMAVDSAKRIGEDTISISEIERGLEVAREIAKK